MESISVAESVFSLYSHNRGYISTPSSGIGLSIFPVYFNQIITLDGLYQTSTFERFPPPRLISYGVFDNITKLMLLHALSLTELSLYHLCYGRYVSCRCNGKYLNFLRPRRGRQGSSDLLI